MVASVFNFPPSLRTSAHTGVAIRIPHGTDSVDRLPTKDCHVALVLLAMTSKDRRQYRNLGTRSTQSAWKQCRARHARLNRVKCTVAKWFAQSTSEWPKTLPRGSNGGRSPLGLSFFHIFLQTKKDMATGGRRLSREVGKIVHLPVSLPPSTITSGNFPSPML